MPTLVRLLHISYPPPTRLRLATTSTRPALLTIVTRYLSPLSNREKRDSHEEAHATRHFQRVEERDAAQQ